MRWPWSPPRVINAPSPSVWPKKVYFLDGPFAGQTREGAMPGLEIVMPTLRVENLMAKINAMVSWKLSSTPRRITTYRYAWETVYPRAEVAYARLVGG